MVAVKMVTIIASTVILLNVIRSSTISLVAALSGTIMMITIAVATTMNNIIEIIEVIVSVVVFHHHCFYYCSKYNKSTTVFCHCEHQQHYFIPSTSAPPITIRIVIPYYHPYYHSPHKSIEYGFGSIIIRSPYVHPILYLVKGDYNHSRSRSAVCQVCSLSMLVPNRN